MCIFGIIRMPRCTALQTDGCGFFSSSRESYDCRQSRAHEQSANRSQGFHLRPGRVAIGWLVKERELLPIFVRGQMNTICIKEIVEMICIATNENLAITFAIQFALKPTRRSMPRHEMHNMLNAMRK